MKGWRCHGHVHFLSCVKTILNTGGLMLGIPDMFSFSHELHQEGSGTAAWPEQKPD